jgi:hypothetical protein
LAGVNKPRLPNHPVGYQGNEVDEAGNPKVRNVEMNLFQGHYFIEERSNVTSYYLKNIMTWDIEDCDKISAIGVKVPTNKKNQTMKSRNLIKEMFAMFRLITLGEDMVYSTIYYRQISLESVQM